LNLEDFLRRIVLAVKSARASNLHYPPYPLARSNGSPDAALVDSREIARLSENHLARFAILPEEEAIVQLYRRIKRDALRACYPKNWESVSFHCRYLADGGLGPVETALDALLWYLVWNTSRTLTAARGLRVIQAFFEERSNAAHVDRSQAVALRYQAWRRSGFREVLHELPLDGSPFPLRSQFIIVASEEAPIEGLNTVFASFQEDPLRLCISSRVLEAELARMGEPQRAHQLIAGQLLAVVEERLGSLAYMRDAGVAVTEGAAT